MCTFCDSHNRASILAKLPTYIYIMISTSFPAVFCQNVDINQIYTCGFVIQSYGRPITALYIVPAVTNFLLSQLLSHAPIPSKFPSGSSREIAVDYVKK